LKIYGRDYSTKGWGALRLTQRKDREKLTGKKDPALRRCFEVRAKRKDAEGENDRDRLKSLEKAVRKSKWWAGKKMCVRPEKRKDQSPEGLRSEKRDMDTLPTESEGQPRMGTVVNRQNLSLT